MLSIKKRPLGKDWLEFYENQWKKAKQSDAIDIKATKESSDPYIEAKLGL